MPYTDTQRLTAVQTAMDAVIDAISSGEYMVQYSVGTRTYRGETPSELIRVLREEERILRYRLAHATATSGGRAVARFENEPQ